MDAAADCERARRSDGKRGLATGREQEKKCAGSDREMEGTSECEGI
jgi:hypothetical protein